MVRSLARSTWRAQRAGLVSIGVVLAALTAVVAVSAAGARRTQTSLPRASDAGAFHDVGLDLSTLPEPPTGEQLDRISRLPQVESFGSFTAELVGIVAADGSRRIPEQGELLAIAPRDRAFGVTLDRSRLLEGREPNPDEPLEVAVNEGMARDRQLEPGDTFDITTVSTADGERLFERGEPPLLDGPVLRLRVTGVVRHLFDSAGTSGAPEELLVVTPAFEERFGRDNVGFEQGPFFRLERGDADAAAFEKEARRILGNPSGLVVSRRSEDLAGIEDGLRVDALALVLFGAVVFAAGAVVLGSAMLRQARGAEPSVAVAVALGATRRRASLAVALPSLVTAAVATAAGLAAAAAASPLMPTGDARRLEPNPGAAVNVAVLAACGLAMIAAMGTVVLMWALAPRPMTSSVSRPLGVTSRAARLGLPTPVLVGMQLVSDPAPGRRGNARTAAVGSVVAAAAVAASLTFGSALERLLDTPRLFGWDFDAAVEADDPGSAADLARRIRGVAEVSEYRKLPVDVEGVTVEAIAVDTSRGAVFPTLVGGRLPARAGEVLLGARTRRRLGVGDGDEVTIRGGRTATFRVVGTTAVVTTDGDQVGQGAVLSGAGLDRLQPDEGAAFHSMFVRYEEGADASVIERELSEVGTVVRPAPSSDVANLSSARRLPILLALVLGGLAVAVLVHVLLVAVRGRATDLAVLRALGFLRRQSVLVVVSQALTLVVLALVAGLPAGIAAGRAGWSVVATSLGVKLEAPTPALELALAAAAVSAAGVMASLAPAALAARRSPAELLRNE